MRMQTRLEVDRRELAARFWHMVRQSRGPDACWFFKGCKNAAGYGYWKSHDGVSPALAHRVAWELTYGPIKDGICIRHTCRNHACCRPMHLIAVEPKNLGTRKLTTEQANAVVSSLASGVSFRKTASALGVGRGAVGAIARGLTWCDLPRPANMRQVVKLPVGYPGPKILRPRPALCG